MVQSSNANHVKVELESLPNMEFPVLEAGMTCATRTTRSQTELC